MNQLSLSERAAVVHALVEGNSIRATSRMTGVSKTTILKLIADFGPACREYHDAHVRGLTTRRVQCDEVWAFCYAKEKNVPMEKRGTFGFGDVWTWTCIDADSKLMVGYHVSERDVYGAIAVMKDVAGRLTNRVQLTTDGLHCYWEAVAYAFDCEVDYAMLVKTYGPDKGIPAGRYSPAICTGCTKTARLGSPAREHVSTSFVERSNLTLRMGSRRYTRLTNAFSKKLANLEASVAMHFMHYNFARPHMTLGKARTPAMAAGLTDHVWSIEELVGAVLN
jgi:transposase